MKKTLQTFCFALAAAFSGLAGAESAVSLETYPDQSVTTPAGSFVDCIRNKGHDEWEAECYKKAETAEDEDLLNSLKFLTERGFLHMDALIIETSR